MSTDTGKPAVTRDELDETVLPKSRPKGATFAKALKATRKAAKAETKTEAPKAKPKPTQVGVYRVRLTLTGLRAGLDPKELAAIVQNAIEFSQTPDETAWEDVYSDDETPGTCKVTRVREA